MLCISIDIDWSPDQIVTPVLDILEDKGIPATLFCTDPATDLSKQSSVRPMAGRQGFEIGLHPNFVGRGDYADVLLSAKAAFPQARGLRMHKGVSGWPICEAAARLDFKYEVYCTVLPTYIPPFYVNEAALDFTILMTSFFDSQAFFVEDFGWRPEDLWFWPLAEQPDRLFILGFHPNILFYDMRSLAEYEAMKARYHEPDRELRWTRKGGKPGGAMKLLLDLIERTPKNAFVTIGEFLRMHPARRQSDLLRDLSVR